jgi:hypothetical protein
MNNQSYISPEHINAYHQGKLTPAEEHALEKAALDNPLLAEALEGFEHHDAARLTSKLNKRWRGSGYWWMLALPVTVALALVFGWPEAQKTPAHNEPVRTAAPVGEVQNQLPPHITDTRMTDSSVQITLSGPERTMAEKYLAITPREAAPEPISLKKPEPIHTPANQTGMRGTHDQGERIFHIAHYRVVDYSDRQNPTAKDAYLGGITADRENETGESSADRPTAEIAYNTLLREAIKAFAAEQNPRCAAIMAQILKTFPDDLNALFYGGMAHLRMENHTQAADLLAAAQQHPKRVFHQEAAFYRATALIAIGNPEGREMMKAIEVRDEFYSARAKEALEKN